MVGCALVLGGGSAWYVINHLPEELYDISNGPWVTSEHFGNQEADPYTRAVVARKGLFALKKEETIYYTAEADDNGDPLSAEHDYRIEGISPAARWWSITVYGPDHYLIPNERRIFSYHMENVGADEQGRFTIHLSPDPKEHNWLPSGESGRLSVTMRLYNPAPEVYENLGTIPMPKIIKEERR